MLTELHRLINEFLENSPYIVSRQVTVLVGGVRLIFPLEKEKVREFARILHDSETPGWGWQASLVPMVFVKNRADFQGNWAALEVSRKPLRRA